MWREGRDIVIKVILGNCHVVFELTEKPVNSGPVLPGGFLLDAVCVQLDDTLLIIYLSITIIYLSIN